VKKLNSREISCLFVGYSDRYRGFRFYCPSIKNIKPDNAKKIFEDTQSSGSQIYQDFTFEKEYIVIPIIIVPNDEIVVSLQNENIVVPLKFILK